MASTLYTDIKKWKDGKPGSLFCRPREGLFGLREWTKDKELSHLVEDADEFFGAGLVARPFSPQDSHSSGGTAFDHGSTGPGAKRRRKSPPAAAERDDNDEDAGLLLLLGAACDDSNNDDDDTDDARQSDRGAKRAKREDSEADGRGTAAAAAAAGRDASEERACAPSPAPASAPGASMLTLTVAIADARARGDVRTAETLGARRREEIIAADAELRDAMLRAGRIVSLNGASAGETHEAWRQAFAMAAARGIDRCEAAMMVLDAEQKAKLKRGEKSKSPRRATAPEETGTGTGTGTDKGDGSRTMGDIIIRALSSSQAQAATAPPGVVADPAPINPGSGFGSGLGLGPGSAAAASGAESTLPPRRCSPRDNICARSSPCSSTARWSCTPRSARIRRRFNPSSRSSRCSPTPGARSRRKRRRRGCGTRFAPPPSPKGWGKIRRRSPRCVYNTRPWCAWRRRIRYKCTETRVSTRARGLRVPSRARGARRRRLELPSSSLARPPRFYVSTAGLARGEGFTPRAVDTRLWVARRRRRESSLASARECHGSYSHQRWAETKRFRRARASSRRRRHAGSLLAARARDPRPTARPPGTSRSSGCTPPTESPRPHSPPHTARRISSTARSAGVPSAGATGIKPSARAENAAPPSPSSSSSPSSHSSPPWCTTISTRTTRTRDACATSAWSSRSTRITARPITIPINANADNDCRDLKTRRAARWTMWTELKRARGFSREVGAMGSAASAGESCRRRSRMMQRGSRGRWVPGRSRGKEEGAKDGESREDARGAG